MAKVILFGQAKFGLRVLEELAAAGHTVVRVSVPPDREGARVDPLKQAALERAIPVVQRRSYKPQEAYDEVAPQQADLCVLAYVTQIIPASILDAPRFASICFHPSLLPAYRGGSAIAWQLIAGETTGGVTVFRPDDRVDAGPIYVQKRISIGPDESAGSFYYGSIFEPAVEAVLEAVELALSGAQGTPQDEALATHQPLCRDEHAGIDWTASAREVHNLVRGCDPSPGAHSLLAGRSIRFFGSHQAGHTAADEPGTVLALSEAGVEVAVGDGSVTFEKIACDGRKSAALEGAQAAGLAFGVRVGR